jgi:small subunit ribosomal protein S4
MRSRSAKARRSLSSRRGEDFAAARTAVQWLEINRDNLSGKVIALPKREDVNLPVNEQLIVELYSK